MNFGGNISLIQYTCEGKGAIKKRIESKVAPTSSRTPSGYQNSKMQKLIIQSGAIVL
jgi:hypothetical protein